MDETSGMADSLQRHEAEEMRLLRGLKDSLDKGKGTIMDTPVIENIYKPGTSGVMGDGLGLGGGGLGLVALLALLGVNRNASRDGS